jgi:hypothetical protein
VIVCKDCGQKNQNGTTFCSACGTFLEWAGESVLTGVQPVIPAPAEPVQDPPPPPAEQPVVVPPPLPTPIPPVTPPVTTPPVEPAPPPPAPVVEPAPVTPPPVAPPPVETPGSTGAAFQAQRLPVIAQPDPPPAAVPAPAPADEPEERKPTGAARPGTHVLRAMRMKARPAPKAPKPPDGPAARPPAEEQERRAPRPPSPNARPKGNPGDIFCSSCGTPNDPSRHYCRSCGSLLAGAVPAAPPRLSWWRRLLGHKPKTAAPLPAGARPTAGSAGGGHGLVGKGQGAVNSVAHIARRFFQVVALLGALGFAVVAIGPWRSHARTTVQGWITDVRRVVQPHYVVVIPDKITATSSLADDPPQNAFDGVRETFWAEAARGNGEGQVLTVHFSSPVDLSRIGVLDGDQSSVPAFAKRPVPSALELLFYNADGAIIKRSRIRLEQTPDFQHQPAEASHVSTLRIRIVGAYPSEKGSRTSASISEIELFKKD